MASTTRQFYSLGSMAMGAAALNDAAAWCLLVLAISLGNYRCLDSIENRYIFPLSI